VVDIIADLHAKPQGHSSMINKNQGVYSVGFGCRKEETYNEHGDAYVSQGLEK
jgi:hypothetical protein